jgi:hypothetical protein
MYRELELACSEQYSSRLHLQFRLRWGRRHRNVHSVRGREVQVIDRIGPVQQLSVKLKLACGELSFDEVRLQRGLVGGRRRRMHGVCRRQVQKYSWRCKLQLLPGGLKLA